jgi:Asp-tRNA(Asn)/Glu-tRNA(Gln) amidotransferase A subunit family amidase
MRHAVFVLALMPAVLFAAAPPFAVEEASIAQLHEAIQQGRTTCTQVVQAYVERARAYNGACTALVTADGKPIPAARGAVRALRPLNFPTRTVAVATLLPDFSRYHGLPIEYGRLEATASDPTVRQQFGMVAGVPDAGQLAALNTLNLRGERSVTCKGDFDRHPAKGPLPAGAPVVCEKFRQQPDALERAAELDRQYGSHPDLAALPMYCVAFSFKDVYDTTDMRTTGGADVSYAMDAAPRDSTIVAELRAKGAIIYAKANLAEYNAGSGDPGGRHKRATTEFGAGARSTWGGPTCNPYDTERETGGSSSGSAVSVGANLAACSICEETGGSCRQPAWRNGVVGFVTTKGLMPYGGAIGADPYLDRAGIQCRSVNDAARVLDALRDPQRGYFDPRDIYSALPKSLVPAQPYASFAASEAPAAGSRPLAGLRIGIVREYMVKHAANDRAVSDQMDAEIKKVLRDQLGAELLESRDPAYPDDPGVPDMAYTFQQALAEILPMHMPEYLTQTRDGKPLFAVPGFDISSREYMAQAYVGKAPLSDRLNIRTVTSSPRTSSFSLHLATYLLERGDARVHDWVSLNANAKYYTEDRVAAMGNWAETLDMRSEGITQRVKMREVMRLVIAKVMRQNGLDVLVNPTTTIPPAKIGHANQPTVNNRPAGRFPTSADLGIPEITVPAGFNSVIYEPSFELNDAADDYVSVANETRPGSTRVPMPVGISFWAGVGEEPMLIRIASTYEAATRHRRPPQAFGPLGKQTR